MWRKLDIESNNEQVTALGNNTFPTRIYGSSVWSNKTITTSDERIKENFNNLEKYEKMFFELSPVSFTYKNDKKGKVSIGITVQNLEKAAENNGIDIKSHSVYNEMVADEEEDKYVNGIIKGVCYNEFIMLNTHMIQQAYKKIETQQQEIDTLKEQVSFLMQKLGDDVND